ncbi:MAG: FAD-dependent oxidoreductase [Candidatus Omnitrophica bacterium]|nr:FAD-dependent oxidoreductase [Candidatus Omnitrophota bacterium]
MKEVIIIGGGISGLTCGLHLAESGYRVTILEKEAILGGLARSFFIKGHWIPLTYHHVMNPDKVTQAYINKFGFLKDLHWIKSSQVFWYENRQYLLSKPRHIFSFTPLDFTSKLRLFYLGLYILLKRNWTDLNKRDCSEWLNKIVGEKTTKLLFQNLVDIKFNMPLSSMSAAWLGKRMHQSIRNKDRYGCIVPGWHQLLDKMAEEIIGKKGKIFKNFEVTKVGIKEIEGIGSDNKQCVMPADVIVSTIPPPIFKSILSLPNKSKLSLDNIRYRAIISFVCGSSQDISHCYWSVVLKPRLVFGGFFNQTILAPWVSADGEYIYYFFTYLENNDQILEYNEDTIKNLYLNDIQKLFPHFSINWYKLFRIRFSQPVFIRNYENPPIELADNIYLAGVYRQFPRPRTMDAAFYSGLETAKYIINKHGKN